MNDFRRRRIYEAVFYATYGLGPWPCVFCGKLVYFRDENIQTRLNIHHQNHDNSNCEPSNLAASHHSCHISSHHKGTKKPYASEIGKRIQPLGTIAAHTPEANEKRKASLARWRLENPEYAAEVDRRRTAAAVAANTGARRSTETRKRMSHSAKNRKKAPNLEEDE